MLELTKCEPNLQNGSSSLNIDCESKKTQEKVPTINICGECENENPRSLCSRCKVIRYCDQNCQKQNWAKHKNICFYSIQKDEDLFSVVEKCFEKNVFTNTPIYFKYANDDSATPRRNFRIINNPNGKMLKSELTQINFTKIIAFDKSVPSELIKILSEKFNIKCQMGGTINGVTSFEQFSKVEIQKV